MYTYSSRSNFKRCRVGLSYLQDATDPNNNINSVLRNGLGVINAVVEEVTKRLCPHNVLHVS